MPLLTIADAATQLATSRRTVDEYDELRIALAKECSCDAQEVAKEARSDAGRDTGIGD